ncbi:C-type lectin mannose-binding isoform-like [Clavelina lepadiformis]|uniref:C-type lectin mannose-binding isoform-like n=1 Tax=Clavelina lepadiformis TaxID=159417 RepID=UPI004043766B
MDRVMFLCFLVIYLSLVKSLWGSPLQNDQEGSGENLKEALRHELVQDGWFLIDSYAYKVTNESQNWSQTREICKNMGAHLAHKGIRNNILKLKLARAIIGDRYWDGVWLGLNDLSAETIWVWLDGTRANCDVVRWGKEEPNGHRLENCGELWGEFRSYFINDNVCSEHREGLCERKIVP